MGQQLVSFQNPQLFHCSITHVFTVLTIIAALWSKIEYRTKQLAPWKEMSKGFAHADKTLLLDYISPINFIAGVSALKDRHFAVAISVLGSLVIRILIIISTGLLVLQNQIIQHKLQPLKVSDKFDASSFNASSVDTRSYLNVYGVAHLNQSFPRGTTHQYAFQSFNTSNQFVSTYIVFVIPPRELFSLAVSQFQLYIYPKIIHHSRDCFIKLPDF